MGRSNWKETPKQAKDLYRSFLSDLAGARADDIGRNLKKITNLKARDKYRDYQNNAIKATEHMMGWPELKKANFVALAEGDQRYYDVQRKRRRSVECHGVEVAQGLRPARAHPVPSPHPVAKDQRRVLRPGPHVPPDQVRVERQAHPFRRFQCPRPRVGRQSPAEEKEEEGRPSVSPRAGREGDRCPETHQVLLRRLRRSPACPPLCFRV
eukprot:jgi/Mesvir1/1636/Mv02874-RA.1